MSVYCRRAIRRKGSGRVSPHSRGDSGDQTADGNNISDSSTDRTLEIARELGAAVVNPDRLGYGYAYRYGFSHARGDYVVMGDADTTYDFTELPKLFRLVDAGDADLAMADSKGGFTPCQRYTNTSGIRY